jgi:hypothetical protein
VNCQAPIPGDGVPLHVSNPQSAALAELQRQVDAVHAFLTERGVPPSPWLMARVRALELRGVADGLEAASKCLQVAKRPQPAPPFPDDDAFLPVRLPVNTALAGVWWSFVVLVLSGLLFLFFASL